MNIRNQRAMFSKRCVVALITAMALAMACAMGAWAETPTDASKNSIFQLPLSVEAGEGKEVSVLLDADHLKLATITLRDGTALPPHSTPVPATILVLEGKGLIHAGGEAIYVAKGTIVSLEAGQEHDVVPSPESDMLLLVHYLKGEADGPAPADDHHHH